MQPIITVIVPTYNVENYIETCLVSLMHQTFKPIEILVIDDCSTDRSLSVVEKLSKQDKRIKIIRNKTNQGIAETRNIALSHIKTPYVSFLDSDDWVDDDFYEKLYTNLQKENADIAISDVLYYYNENKQNHEWVSRWNQKSGKTVITKAQDKQYNIYACACWDKLYKTDLFKRLNIKLPKGLCFEDVPICFLTVMLAKKLVIVKDAVLYYRMHTTSIMATAKADRKPFDILDIYDFLTAELNRFSHLKNINDYRQILDNFKIFNIYNWYKSTHPSLKDEFWEKMKKAFLSIDIKGNPYITAQNKKTYKTVCHRPRILSTTTVRLFDFLPLLKYERTEKSKDYYLFSLFPALSIKHKTQPMIKKTHHLFGIPLLTAEYHKSKIKYYLLGLPIFKIRYIKDIRRYYLFSRIFLFSRKIRQWFSIPHSVLTAENFTPLSIDDRQLLAELKAMEPFTFIPNPGNLGDVLITASTLDFFDKHHLKYKICDKDYTGNIVYGGGGAFIPAYQKFWMDLLKKLKPAQKILILPSSFWQVPDFLSSLDDRFTVMAREKESYQYLSKAKTPARILLDDDMALRSTENLIKRAQRFTVLEYLPLQKLHHQLKSVGNIAYFLRNDAEKSNSYSSEIDLSNCFGFYETSPVERIFFGAQLMLAAVDKFDVIITDRLHVGVAGILMGKHVYWLDNSYGKISNVYRHALSHINRVHFCTELPSIDEVIVRQTGTDNLDRMIKNIQKIHL